MDINQIHHSLSLYEGIVSKEKVMKIRKFRSINDAALSLFGEVLVRLAIKKNIGVSNCDIHIMHHTNGKPYTLVKGRQIYFNISHSNDYVICGIDDNEIGIDIEKILDIDLSISELVLSNYEREKLLELDKYAQKKYFYTIWTLKESFLKYTGEGLNDELSRLSFECSEEIKLYFENVISFSDLKFSEIQIDPEYKCHVCCNDTKVIAIEKITEEEIIKFFLNE